MEVAKVSSKGQITIPISVRIALGLSAGDRIVIQEENGRYYFDNASLLEFSRAREKVFHAEARTHEEKNKRTMPIGIADGKYIIPDDLDTHNDEIASMFGVE